MPSVTRKRRFESAPEEVFDLVSDPRRQAGWWPRVTRVEHVSGSPGAARTRWTSVLAANSGRLLRLDYRCTGSTRPGRYEWEQELGGTGFEKHLERQAFLVSITATDGGAEISLTSIHTLKGTARLAGFAMRKSQRELLDEALESLAALLQPSDSGREA